MACSRPAGGFKARRIKGRSPVRNPQVYRSPMNTKLSAFRFSVPLSLNPANVPRPASKQQACMLEDSVTWLRASRGVKNGGDGGAKPTRDGIECRTAADPDPEGGGCERSVKLASVSLVLHPLSSSAQFSLQLSMAFSISFIASFIASSSLSSPSRWHHRRSAR
ncbi:hypothetical protein EJ06DRAFT_54819 [Trichodelitschia bisporula]|uniref:Uncharacterized protein n=1 Tax=Trichodelitschia bisporula TaxID=703511 RepID=A0A6G1HU29_9PEZI|nr:hypothetical protein EJ06DRAFT_54819 [Trichodelitschia bisporula]